MRADYGQVASPPSRAAQGPGPSGPRARSKPEAAAAPERCDDSGRSARVHRMNQSDARSRPLDGYVAGPTRSAETKSREGGAGRLTKWVVATDSWRRQHGSRRRAQRRLPRSSSMPPVASARTIHGTQMLGGAEGPWDEEWRGCGARSPPSHGPVSCSTTTSARRSAWRAARVHSSERGLSSRRSVEARAAAGDEEVAISRRARAPVRHQYIGAGGSTSSSSASSPIVRERRAPARGRGDPVLERSGGRLRRHVTNGRYRLAR